MQTDITRSQVFAEAAASAARKDLAHLAAQRYQLAAGYTPEDQVARRNSLLADARRWREIAIKRSEGRRAAHRASLANR